MGTDQTCSKNHFCTSGINKIVKKSIEIKFIKKLLTKGKG